MTNRNLKPGQAPPAIARTIANAETSSLKRLAWAFGCARKGSDEERQLEVLLTERVLALQTVPVCRAPTTEESLLLAKRLREVQAETLLLEDAKEQS